MTLKNNEVRYILLIRAKGGLVRVTYTVSNSSSQMVFLDPVQELLSDFTSCRWYKGPVLSWNIIA